MKSPCHARSPQASRSAIQACAHAWLRYCGVHRIGQQAFATRCGVSYSTLGKMTLGIATQATVDRVHAFLAAEATDGAA